MFARLLFGLLHRVMAGLTKGLKVGLTPEQRLITTMRLDVVTDELACVAFEASALRALACVQITKEDLEP